MLTSVLTGLEELGFAAALLLLDSWWQSLALMGGVWLALRLWRGVNAATRYALWCTALLGGLSRAGIRRRIGRFIAGGCRC